MVCSRPCRAQAYVVEAYAPTRRNRRSPTTPTAIFRARMRLHLLALALLSARPRCCLAAALGGRRPPRRSRSSTATARRAATCSTAPGTPRRPQRPGTSSCAASARQASPGWQRDHGADRPSNAGDFSIAELHGDRPLVPQGLPAARAARRVQVGRCASSRSTTAPGVAERQAARLPRRRLSAVRAARQERPPQRRQPPRRAGRQPPPEVRHPAAVACAAPAPSRAAGGTTTASCARSTCAGSTPSTSQHGVLPAPRCAAARCAAAGRRDRRRSRTSNSARRDGRRSRGTLRRPRRCASRRTACPGRGDAPLPRPRADPPTRACGGPSDPSLYTGRLQLRDRAGAWCSATRSTPASARLRVSRLGRIQLNGRDVNLRGASIHEDSLSRGAALTPGQMRAEHRTTCASSARTSRAPTTRCTRTSSSSRTATGSWSGRRSPCTGWQSRLFDDRRGARQGAADAAHGDRPRRQPSRRCGLEHRQRERLAAGHGPAQVHPQGRRAPCTTSTRRG